MRASVAMVPRDLEYSGRPSHFIPSVLQSVALRPCCFGGRTLGPGPGRYYSKVTFAWQKRMPLRPECLDGIARYLDALWQLLTLCVGEASEQHSLSWHPRERVTIYNMREAQARVEAAVPSIWAMFIPARCGPHQTRRRRRMAPKGRHVVDELLGMWLLSMPSFSFQKRGIARGSCRSAATERQQVVFQTHMWATSP